MVAQQGLIYYTGVYILHNSGYIFPKLHTQLLLLVSVTN